MANSKSTKVKIQVGDRFGRWTVLERAENTSYRMSRWICVCDCGTKRVVVNAGLSSGSSQSSGCLQKQRASETSKKHGKSTAPEGRTWAKIRFRCYNPSDPRYADYGGRGIVMCDRWRDSCAAFLEDMGPRPSSCLPHPIPLISATKGVEEDSSKLMTQIMDEVLPESMEQYLMALSGPSFASELSAGKPTAVCLAGRDPHLVARFPNALMTPALRVYADTDLIGLQLGGALKNVMALAAGMVDGLDLGHNARAALITRGLAEIVRLGAAMGDDPRTLYGLSGVGDQVLTCTGSLSRNHTVGVRLGQGESLDAILGGMQAVAEGVRTARAALGLARRHQVEMPITQEINAVLFEGKSCRKAVSDLMERDAKPEKGRI